MTYFLHRALTSKINHSSYYSNTSKLPFIRDPAGLHFLEGPQTKLTFPSFFTVRAQQEKSRKPSPLLDAFVKPAFPDGSSNPVSTTVSEICHSLLVFGRLCVDTSKLETPKRTRRRRHALHCTQKHDHSFQFFGQNISHQFESRLLGAQTKRRNSCSSESSTGRAAIHEHPQILLVRPSV